MTTYTVIVTHPDYDPSEPHIAHVTADNPTDAVERGKVAAWITDNDDTRDYYEGSPADYTVIAVFTGTHIDARNA